MYVHIHVYTCICIYVFSNSNLNILCFGYPQHHCVALIEKRKLVTISSVFVGPGNRIGMGPSLS